MRRFDRVRVPPAEMYAGNCIRVNDAVLVAQGFPLFAESIRQYDYNVVELDMSEYRKMDGGLSCLSLRF